MIRKCLFAAAALLIAGVALKATNLDGYVKVYWDKLANKIKKAPSLEDRVAKLKVDLSKIEDEMKARISEQIRLERESKRVQADLAKESEKLTTFEGEHKKLTAALKTALDDRNTQVKYDNDQLSVDSVNRRLITLNSLIPSQRKTVEKLKEDSQNVNQTLDVVKKDLDQMKEDKEKFETLVKNLERRVQQLRQAEREHKVGSDRSWANRLETDANDLEDDVATQERYLEKAKEYGLIKAKQNKEEAKGPSPEETLKAAQLIQNNN
jgi:chromosome segregation ATPase